MLRSGGTQVEIKTVSGINGKGKGWVGRKEKACNEISGGCNPIGMGKQELRPTKEKKS